MLSSVWSRIFTSFLFVVSCWASEATYVLLVSIFFGHSSSFVVYMEFSSVHLFILCHSSTAIHHILASIVYMGHF